MCSIGQFVLISASALAYCSAFTEFLVGIKWMPYWVALLSAQSQHKPIFLLVYDDRCPECRRLKSEIEDSPYRKEFEQLSKNFVMTNVNDKEIRKPDDKEFSPDGHYKPRIVFLTSNGKRITSITNSIRYKRYLHFYNRLEDIIRDMKRAFSYHKRIRPIFLS